MAQLDTQYYSGNDQYSDGSIEERILQIVQDGGTLETYRDRSFSVLYHLSPVRENILSWYDFRKDASVLEIGAGPGAVTGLLCRRCRAVTSVELSLRRARINYERHKAYENLTILVGNLNDMQFPRQFDYVILNGVFEYAGSFTAGEDPYGTFLKRCAGYLKKDGLLLIAIENRLGLKYFAGAPEDHTENYMEGLKNYPDNSAVHTFSKQEWEELCERCALPYRKFYYPYPDYKFPNEIFTEETLRAEGFGKNAWNFNPGRLELFSEQEMGRTLCREGVMDCFMNSFLIEAGFGEPCHEEEVLYAKISSDRDVQYRIQTVIKSDAEGTMHVVKSPLSEEALSHIASMQERECDPDVYCGWGGRLLKGDPQEDGSVRYPFLMGESLTGSIREDASSIREACGLLLELAGEDHPEEDGAYTDDFTSLFGPARPEESRERLKMVCPANIDLIFDNIFPAEDHVDIIDGEWIVDTPVPVLFLLWRAVNELYTSRKELESVLPQAVLLKEYGISAADRQLFWKWASHFEKEYVKANSLGTYAVPVRKADLKNLPWSGQEIRLTATLYTDRGEGFREEDALHTEVTVENGRYDVSFEPECPEEVRALRFDPLEGSACICDLRTEDGILRAMNASAISGRGQVFLTMDPAYRLHCGKVPGKIRINGTVRIKDVYWALEKSQELLKKARLGPGARLARGIVRRIRR